MYLSQPIKYFFLVCGLLHPLLKPLPPARCLPYDPVADPASTAVSLRLTRDPPPPARALCPRLPRHCPQEEGALDARDTALDALKGVLEILLLAPPELKLPQRFAPSIPDEYA